MLLCFHLCTILSALSNLYIFKSFNDEVFDPEENLVCIETNVKFQKKS
mgnify:CR=1 FL=1